MASNGIAPPPPPLVNGVAHSPPPPPPPKKKIVNVETEADDDMGPVLKKAQKKDKKGWGSTARNHPPSIEEFLKQKIAHEEATKKPRYMNKAERERVALEKREREVALKKQEEEEERKRVERRRKLNDPNYQANGESNGHTNGCANGYSHSTRSESVDSDSMEGIETSGPLIPTGPRAMTGNGNVPTGPAAMRKPEMPPPPVPAKSDRMRPAVEEAEYQMIRKRYMGEEQQQSTFSAKKKRKRTTEKKFNFDWSNDDDTSVDYNPLYQNRVEATFYGRGKLGGFGDEEITRKSKIYAQSMAQKAMDPQREKEYLEMDRRRREEGHRSQIDKHWSKKELSQMRERDWRIFKEDFNIATKGGGIPNPMRSWAESGLPEKILNTIDQVGYSEPSAIQRAAIPIALQSRDLIGVAVTGSGKTAAFLLPLLVYISDLPPLNESTKYDGPYAIILAPTRELAQQIEVEAKKFATPLGFKTAVLVGGHSIEEQSFSLRDGAEIIIATPGRLVDCIERRVLVLSQCCYVIMDEADRMIDLGFEEPVNKILNALPVSNEKPDTEDAENSQAMSQLIGMKDRYRQTMMYTATMPAAVERIAKKYLRRPAIVTIGNVGEAVETVEQRVEFIPGEEKRKKRMAEILTSGEFPKPMIVFVNIKRNCETICRDIKNMTGLNAVTLHGGKSQEQREQSLHEISTGKAHVLVATDLAGRGIDISDVGLVLNFNMATSIEQYTHRIGRTGRAGKSGVAITFWDNSDADVLYDLRQMLAKSQISKVPEDLKRHEASQQKGGKKGNKDVNAILG